MSVYMTAKINGKETFADVQTGIADEIYGFIRESTDHDPHYGKTRLDAGAFARFLAGRHEAVLDIYGEPGFDENDPLYYQTDLVLAPTDGNPEETVDAFNTASTLFGIPVKDVTEFTVEIS